MNQEQTYILILRDSLVNKKRILNTLIRLTGEQMNIVKNVDSDITSFEEILQVKGHQIDMLNMVDEGFDNIYNNIREELLANPNKNEEMIMEVQELIKEVVALGSELEAMEYKNKEYVEAFISRKKSEVREFKTSNHTAANYYKNMTNMHIAGNTYFMDQKK